MAYEVLHHFMEKALCDNRIHRGHIAVYLALFHFWMKQGFSGPLSLYGAEVMPLAKISSSATYHRLVIELRDWGYLCYDPSFYKKRASRIYMVFRE